MILGLIRKIISPKSYNKDKARKEYILNILLLGSLVITFFTFIVNIVNRYYNTTIQGAISPQIIIILFLFLLSLFFLSKKGKEQLAASLLIIFFYFPATYTFYKWGAGIPIAWLIYALLIVISGVLIGTRFAFLLTLFVVITSSTLAYFQAFGFHHPDLSWLTVPYSFGDAVVLNVTLAVIAGIVWLYTREIEKSLKRARASEAELKQERDMLESKVEERTKDLKQAQLEKITQLYRFAEIGRLSSGLFHDLVTPLSLISLHLERLKYKKEAGSIEDMQTQLKKALKATKYLETFVVAVRKQLQNEELKKTFSLNREIKLVMQILQHKAKSMRVSISFRASEEIKLYGSQIKFNQLMINLLLNAIDAYEGIKINEKTREIQIHLSRAGKIAVLIVKDNGVGILQENLKKIFQPFFTTKSAEKGTGIGLSISQEIVEKYLGGTIGVQSNKIEGTIFTITMPLRDKRKEHNESPALLTSN